MVSKAVRLSVILAAVAAAPLLAQQAGSQLVTVRHASGQGVSPVYEGFEMNPDGSYNMWFGYMNRNYEPEDALAVGPTERSSRSGKATAGARRAAATARTSARTCRPLSK